MIKLRNGVFGARSCFRHIDDFGLSDGDNNDKGDDIYGYLGEPIVSHEDLILGHESPDVRLDEGTISKDESDQDSGSDNGSSDSTGKSDNSSEQDSESKQDEDERVRSVSTPRSTSSSEQNTECEQDEDEMDRSVSTPSSEEDATRDVVSRND